MKHDVLRVHELPFEPVPEYSRRWERPPDDWFAHVSTASARYPDDFIGDFVTFTATEPTDARKSPLIEALGLVVVREYDSPSYANAFESLQDRSIFNGTIHGKFEYFPRLFSMEFPEGNLYPYFGEAKKAANAFVHGIRTERGDA